MGKGSTLKPLFYNILTSNRSGVGPSKAMYALSKNLSVEERADASMVPNLSSLYCWNAKYKNEQFGDMGGNKIFDVIAEFSKSSEAKIKIQTKSDVQETNFDSDTIERESSKSSFPVW